MADEQVPPPASGAGIDPKLASLLAYLFWTVGGIVFYIISKDKYVRFHAMQSILLGVTFFILFWVFAFVPFIDFFSWILYPAFLVISIIMMVKAYGGEKYKLPIIGAIAEKNA